jgi:phosphopantothenoylcysteine decarboxylase/phosphopantothenate--cysteine ligase
MVVGAAANPPTVGGADGSATTFPELAKEDLADAVWDLVSTRLTETPRP